MSAYLSILNIRHYCLLLLPKYVAGLKMKEVSANVVERVAPTIVVLSTIVAFANILSRYKLRHFANDYLLYFTLYFMLSAAIVYGLLYSVEEAKTKIESMITSGPNIGSISTLIPPVSLLPSVTFLPSITAIPSKIDIPSISSIPKIDLPAIPKIDTPSLPFHLAKRLSVTDPRDKVMDIIEDLIPTLVIRNLFLCLSITTLYFIKVTLLALFQQHEHSELRIFKTLPYKALPILFRLAYSVTGLAWFLSLIGVFYFPATAGFVFDMLLFTIACIRLQPKCLRPLICMLLPIIVSTCIAIVGISGYGDQRGIRWGLFWHLMENSIAVLLFSVTTLSLMFRKEHSPD